MNLSLFWVSVVGSGVESVWLVGLVGLVGLMPERSVGLGLPVSPDRLAEALKKDGCRDESDSDIDSEEEVSSWSLESGFDLSRSLLRNELTIPARVGLFKGSVSCVGGVNVMVEPEKDWEG